MNENQKTIGISFLQSMNPGGGAKEQDRIQFPAAAAALGILFLSSNFRDALVSGILVVTAGIFVQVVKGLLKSVVPAWSLTLCVLEAGGVFTSCAFALAFAYLGMDTAPQPWLLGALMGLLAGGHALAQEEEGSYGEILWEGAVVWGWWILLGILREFLGGGTVFESSFGSFPFVSKSFWLTGFGFLAAGLCLAFTCGTVKKKIPLAWSFYVILPAVCLDPPVRITPLGEAGGLAGGIVIGLLFWWSLIKKLQYSRSGPSFRGLPCQLIAMGFLYFILGLY